MVSLPTARKRPNATAYATALQTKRIQRKLLACQKNVNLNETGNGGRNCTSLELNGEATTKQYYFCCTPPRRTHRAGRRLIPSIRTISKLVQWKEIFIRKCAK